MGRAQVIIDSLVMENVTRGVLFLDTSGNSYLNERGFYSSFTDISSACHEFVEHWLRRIDPETKNQILQVKATYVVQNMVLNHGLVVIKRVPGDPNGDAPVMDVYAAPESRLSGGQTEFVETTFGTNPDSVVLHGQTLGAKRMNRTWASTALYGERYDSRFAPGSEWSSPSLPKKAPKQKFHKFGTSRKLGRPGRTWTP